MSTPAPAMPVAPRPSARMRRGFWLAGIWWGIALIVAVGFGVMFAHAFLLSTAPPAFTQLEQLIGKVYLPGDAIPAEILDYTVAEIGPPPEVDPATGAVPLIRRAFRTGNLPPESVQFVGWGPAVPYAHEGNLYWAVPFRYEANFGFGTKRTDTATALVRNGSVSRMLFVPYWNFSGGRGER